MYLFIHSFFRFKDFSIISLSDNDHYELEYSLFTNWLPSIITFVSQRRHENLQLSFGLFVYRNL